MSSRTLQRPCGTACRRNRSLGSLLGFLTSWSREIIILRSPVPKIPQGSPFRLLYLLGRVRIIFDGAPL
jgi:hypothetical protein